MKKILLIALVSIITFAANAQINRTYDISDSPVSGLKRKATWYKFVYDNNEKKVYLLTHVSIYANDGGNYGDSIASIDVRPYDKVLTAGNHNLVNPANGKLVEEFEGSYREVVSHDAVASPIGYYDFFEWLIANQPVIINTLIGQIILFEDSIGSFNKL